MIKFLQKHTSFVLALISAIIIFLISRNFCFFWDSISQISFPANFFYDNNFSQFWLPDNGATGHPPVVAMYFALYWKIFGYNLIVAHLAMFPFVFGAIFQLLKFCKLHLSESAAFWSTLLLIAEPTLVSQMSMLTLDVFQIFFFVLALIII